MQEISKKETKQWNIKQFDLMKTSSMKCETESEDENENELPLHRVCRLKTPKSMIDHRK